MNDETLLYKLYMSFIPGVGPTKQKVLSYIFDGEKNVYEHANSDIDAISFLNKEAKQFLKLPESRRIAEKSLEIIRRKNIKILTPQSAGYPKLLHDIPNPPGMLFQVGEDVGNNAGIGIVGSRKADAYGKKAAHKIGYEAAEYGITVVSGFALGIDFWAHKGCIERGGRTVAVIANSIDEPYPRENRVIIGEMLEKGGTLLSETPPLKKIYPSEFILRNRIISGISILLIVAEAGEKSGTLYTVDHALEQGKEVFSVPGEIFSPCNAGSNNLLKQGASVYTCFEDIREIIEKNISTCVDGHLISAKGAGKIDNRKPEKNKITKEKITPTADERKVIDILRTGGKTVDELCALAGQEVRGICNTLTLMEIKGYIIQQNIGYYEIAKELFF